MFAGHSSSGYKSYTVTVPLYQGPLDLLLNLIERAELDITKLSLAEVTDQYLHYIQDIQDQAVEEVSSFLVIAAKLIQIKSEVLLPQPIYREVGEEDPGDELTRQLKIYKEFKNIANILEERDNSGHSSYIRLSSPPKIDETLDLEGISINDLFEAANSLLTTLEPETQLGTVITPSPVTIRHKIYQIINILKNKGKSTFHTLIGQKYTRLDVVVTFLAVLELIKRYMVVATQNQVFGEIGIEPSDNWDGTFEFELEFGE